MNPKVNDIPGKYAYNINGIRLMVMGTIRKGGGGCACPENAFLKNLLAYLVLHSDEWILLDMEAGIEHLGRGTAIGVDLMTVVVEPNKTSLETALRIEKLSRDLGIGKIVAIGNKVQNMDDRRYIEDKIGKTVQILGFVDYSPSLKELSRGSITVREVDDEILNQIKTIIERMDNLKTENRVS